MSASSSTNLEIANFREYLRHSGGPDTLAERRVAEDAWGQSIPLPPVMFTEERTLGGIGCTRFGSSSAASSSCILYLHGGGFGAGSAKSHGHFVARLAERAGVDAFALDYRLAPEHAFPAALEDSVAAYKALLNLDYLPERIALAGDSAGGGLALSFALALKQSGLPQPGCYYLISPWADLKLTGASHREKANTDPMVTTAGLARMAFAYLQGADPAEDLASPVFGNFDGVAPILIQVGSEEVLLSDSFQVAERAAMANVDVRLEVWAEMVHVWPLYHEHLSAGGRALAEGGDWIGKKIRVEGPPEE